MKTVPQRVAHAVGRDGKRRQIYYVTDPVRLAVRLVLSDVWYSCPDLHTDRDAADSLAVRIQEMHCRHIWADRPQNWLRLREYVPPTRLDDVPPQNPEPVSEADQPLSLSDTLDEMESWPEYLLSALPDTALASLDMCEGGQRLADVIEDTANFIRDLCEQIADRGFDTTKPVSQ